MRTTMTPSTPSTMTRTTTTHAICTSEHGSALVVVFHVSLMMCHTTLAQVVHVSVISSSRHVHVRFSLISSTSLSTSTCPSPSSSTPLSWCTLTCTPTSTTWTPWKITCATPPRGASTPTTSPTPSQVMTQRHGLQRARRLPGSLLLRYSVIGPGHRWHYARQAAHRSTPRIRRLPQSGRCVCQSVVIVCRVR